MSAPTLVPTIDWCHEHGHERWYTEDWCWWINYRASERPSPCVFIKVRLVDPSALVLLRDEEGNWPEWALNVFDDAYTWEESATVTLDLLAAASKEGKT